MDNTQLQHNFQNREKSERVIELAFQLISETNTLNNDKLVAESVFEAITQSHRTLQQGFWRIMFDVADKYKDINHDLRNEAAVKACGKVTEALKDSYLPYV